MENATAYSIKDTDTAEFETLDSVFAHWQLDELNAAWNCIFVLPIWLKAWWSNFGSSKDLYLLTVRQAQRVIGIAPLMRKDRTARLIGDQDVCDCLDFVVAPNRASEFYGRLIFQLRQDGVTRMDLGLGLVASIARWIAFSIWSAAIRMGST